MSLGLPVAATRIVLITLELRIFTPYLLKGIKGRLYRLPSSCVDDMVMANVKKGKPDRKKVMLVVIVRQRKAWRHKDSVFMYFKVIYLKRLIQVCLELEKLIQVAFGIEKVDFGRFGDEKVD
ncbi:hypothetical protein MKX01_041254 [Papaver californicum]|nr:hypothetical protein MKX01_041254 [Papaver californicum]